MGDVEKMFENLNTGVVACDADFKITYANEKYKQMLKAMLDMEGFVGNHMGDCHRPKTMEKIRKTLCRIQGKEEKSILLHHEQPGRETHPRDCSFL